MEQNPSSKAYVLSIGRDFTPAVTVPGLEHGVTRYKLIRNFVDETEHFLDLLFSGTEFL
jgi:hypothetical protein